MNLLLLEDNIELGSLLCKIMTENHFKVEWFRRFQDGKIALKNKSYSCVLLDIHLPDGNGMSLIKEIREHQISTPIIMISAETDLQHRLQGLNDGADDFLIKPFDPEELIARIRSTCRRAAGQTSGIWKVGKLSLDVVRHHFSYDGIILNLSLTEFKILFELIQKHPKVIIKSDLVMKLSDSNEEISSPALDVHVCNIRKTRLVRFQCQQWPSIVPATPSS